MSKQTDISKAAAEYNHGWEVEEMSVDDIESMKCNAFKAGAQHVLDCPEVMAMRDMIEHCAECGCEPGGGPLDLEPGFICGKHRVLAAFDALKKGE